MSLCVCNSVIRLGAYSYSSTDAVYDYVRAVSWLYKDNVVVATDTRPLHQFLDIGVNITGEEAQTAKKYTMCMLI
jgi:hypothetical protein